MTTHESTPTLLTEIFEDIDKKYESITPETIAIRASRFERLLYRFVVLFASLNACIAGLLVLVTEEELTDRWAVIIALAGATVAGLLARRWQESEAFPRVLLYGAALVLGLFIAAVPGGFASAFLMTMLGTAVITLVLANQLPQGSALMFAIYVPVVLVVLERHGLGERVVIELLTLMPMVLIFAWRRLRVAAAGTMVGVIITAFCESEASGADQGIVSLLLGFFLAAACIYEICIRHKGSTEPDQSPEPNNKSSDLRQFLQLGASVGLLYLFIFSLDSAGAWWNSPRVKWWITALIVCLFELFRGWREQPSLPFRIVWAVLAIAIAVLAEEGMPWHSKLLTFLLLGGILESTSLWTGKRFLYGIAIVFVAGVAFASLGVSAHQYGVNVFVVGVLTFIALMLLSQRREFPIAEAGPLRRSTIGRFIRKVFLLGLGTLVRLPFVNWIFVGMKTAFQWLKYFRSSTQPVGFADLLFVGAHIYAVTIFVRMVGFQIRDFGVSAEYETLTKALFVAIWGLALVSYGVRMKRIFERMLGLCIMASPLLLQLKGSYWDTGVYAWFTFAFGFMGWMACWTVLGASSEGKHDPKSDALAE